MISLRIALKELPRPQAFALLAEGGKLSGRGEANADAFEDRNVLAVSPASADGRVAAGDSGPSDYARCLLRVAIRQAQASLAPIGVILFDIYAATVLISPVGGRV